MLSEDANDRLVETCTEIASDALRSIVYFTEDDFDQIFLRDYLSADADIRSFVENERGGFRRIPTHEGSELGRYEYTIRRFESGTLVRVLSGNHGVFVTTNEIPIEQYDELAAAVERELNN